MSNQTTLSLAQAAALLLEDYVNDKVLTAFSILDGEPFLSGGEERKIASTPNSDSDQ